MERMPHAHAPMRWMAASKKSMPIIDFSQAPGTRTISLASSRRSSLKRVICYWIIAEGVCYITGAAFYSLRKARYMHSVFHFFVLGGSACHMVAVWDILVKML